MAACLRVVPSLCAFFATLNNVYASRQARGTGREGHGDVCGFAPMLVRCTMYDGKRLASVCTQVQGCHPVHKRKMLLEESVYPKGIFKSQNKIAFLNGWGMIQQQRQ